MSKTNLILILILCISGLLGAASIQESYLAEARGDYQSALAITQELARQDADEVFYTMRMAWLRYLLGQYNEAATLYRQGLAKLDHPDAHLGIINCHLALGEWDQARSRADLQLKEEPRNPTLLSKAAYAVFMKKDYHTAAEYYARIVSFYPWDMDNRGYWVNNLYLSGNINEAKTQYQILKKYSPQSQIVIDYKGILDQE
jgi:tetratricopeptide (TPR) repeat protein